MNAPFETRLKTQKDLLAYFSSLAKKDGEACQIPMETCIKANYILEEAERQTAETGRQMRNLEQQLEQTKAVYQNMIYCLTELITGPDGRAAQNGNDRLAVPVKQLRDILEKESDQALIENAFERLKDAVLSETRNNTRKIERSRLLGLMGKWLRLPGEETSEDEPYLALMLHCKESFQHILLELEQVLSVRHRKRLREVEAKISRADDIASLSFVRHQVVDLLQEYMAESANDKAQAVHFAEEISLKILEMDKRISGSFESFQAYQERNNRFNEKLSSHLQSLKDALRISTPMQELTDIMNSKISLISEALNHKRSGDYSEEQKLKKQVSILKSGMKRIRDDYRAAKEKTKILESELNTDHLTGAANRRAYEAGAAREMQRYIRYKRTFSLIIFDVDRFKSINDTYGHAIGDKCLKEIAARIQAILRKTDILARTGGDEFVIILPETSSYQAGIAAEKIRTAISRTSFIHKQDRVRISLSLGVAEALQSDTGYTEVFNRADQALYRAKEAGRNQVETAGAS